MANILNFDAETGANAIFDDTGTGLSLDNTGGGSTLSITNTQAANATLAPLTLGNGSVASGAVLALSEDAFVSATSIDFGDTAAVSGHGAIRVVLTDGTFGWIPVLPDARVDAATPA